ncbi:P protein-like isoform X2 [Galleria mellonella]|uniref:P protein-like isoform X2 n=1 Tax=Galleria mellonella TaxID=7137 RepID=A0ABM3MD74_GALME|nr:P protein-like isoform X2 [Galleria mellonella]
MSNLWKGLKELAGIQKQQTNQELNRSQYSLVSTEEVTPYTLRLCLGLPDEVKNDPVLAPFKEIYEKEHGDPGEKATSWSGATKRETDVNPNPSVNDDDELQVLSDEDDAEVADRTENRNKEDKASVDKILHRNYKKKQYIKVTRDKCYVKIITLVACWLFFTSTFLMYNEKRDIDRSTAITNGKDKHYTLQLSDNHAFILVKLSGPFLSENDETKMNSDVLARYHKMEVWLERRTYSYEQNHSNEDFDVEASERWLITLQNDNQLDFNEGEPRIHKFHHKPNSTHTNNTYIIRMRSTSNRTVPFTISYTASPLDVTTGVVYAVVLLSGLYLLIIFEIVNRTMAVIVMATMSLAALTLAGERPSLPELISWMNEETLLLLFCMMLLVAITAETGIFDFLAVFTFEVTKGKLWPMIYLLCGVTALLSAFTDNVTIVLLMSPVTIRICEVMGLDPVPILMLMAIYSNVGGTATPIGDPSNVIVVSNKDVAEAGINFTNFTAHMSLGILLVFIQTSLQIRYIYRDTNKLRLKVPADIQELHHQISIWRRAKDSLPHLNNGVNVIRERLEKKIEKLNEKLDTLIRENSKGSCSEETFLNTLAELKEHYKIRDKVLLLKAMVATAFVVVMFFLHSVPELNRISLGWTVLLGAILLLTLADRSDLEPILHRVEWSTLLFFGALFVFMEALSKLGLIVFIGNLMEQLILMVDERARLAVAIITITWVSGLISACVDNIPLTTMMVRVVVSIGSNPNLNLPKSPLIWALLYGGCLGGNGTLTGTTANVVCAGVAEHHGYKFTFKRFFNTGFPIMVGHLIVASAYLLISHCLFEWH